MAKNRINLILSLSLLSLMAGMTGCGSNGSSNDNNKTKETIKKSIIDQANTTYEVVQGTTISINASNIVNSEKVQSYEWLIDEDVVSDKKKLNIDIHQDIGIHKVCLKLTYKDGTTDMSCRDIKVIKSKLGKPTAIINHIPNSGWKTKCPVTLDANQSRAGEGGTIVSYKWFKDGNQTGSGVKQTFEFNTTKEHNITLQVTDNENNIATKTTIVNVKEIGKPTLKLTILSPYQRVISSDQSNKDTTFPTTTQADNSFLPFEGNAVFFSTHGTFDDCNFTDDNITYIWDGKIYKAGGQNPIIEHCFSQKEKKSYLAKVHTDFNTTGNDYQYFEVKEGEEGYEDAKYIYPYSDPDINVKGTTQHEYVYIELCGGKYLDYDRLEIKLTAKDNLHGTSTSITKTIEIKAAPDTNSSDS